MKNDLFKQCMDRGKLDRLEAEILEMVEKFSAPEFSNLDVARALWECARKRGKREDPLVFESFLQYQHDQLALTLEIRTQRPDLYQCEGVREVRELLWKRSLN